MKSLKRSINHPWMKPLRTKISKIWSDLDFKCWEICINNYVDTDPKITILAPLFSDYANIIENEILKEPNNQQI